MSSDHEPIDKSSGSPPWKVDCLFGQGLNDAFRMFVLEDPTISSLGKKIVEQESEHRSVFAEGCYPGPFISYHWPLEISAEDLAFQFVRPVVFVVPGPPLPTPTAAILEVSRALSDKLSLLRRLLVTGQIVACGTFVRSGTFGPIHRRQWARHALLLDVKSGDVLETIDNEDVIQWTGVVLEAPTPQLSSFGQGATREEMFHVNTTDYGGARPCPSEPGAELDQKTKPLHASIQKAIRVLWPEGIPPELALKVRDQKIIEWQRKQGFAVASSKTIRRFLASKTTL